MAEEGRKPLEVYFEMISRFPLISEERERKLSLLIQQGDEAAFEELITSSLRLVVKISHDYKTRGLPLEDLISEGNMGLLEAARKFNPKKGAKFSTYAAWWIRAYMRRALARQSEGIRVPESSRRRLMKMKAAGEKILRDTGKEATVAQVAHDTGLTVRTTRNMIGRLPIVFSLNASSSTDEESTSLEEILFSDAPGPDEKAVRAEDYRVIYEEMKRISPKDFFIIAERFGVWGHSPHTLDELSMILHCTRENIRQRQNRILKRIRERLENGA